MGLPIFKTETYTPTTCCKCHVNFYMPSDMNANLVRSGGTFFCPSGHPQHYTETTEARLRKQIEQEQKRTKWAEESRDRLRKDLEHEQRSKAAIKGNLTKTKNRIKNGVCPCCNRTFMNLQRHMETKHKGFALDNHKEA